MKNPIIHTPLFKTPKSVDELMEIAESMTNASEAYRMIAFTMNLCHRLVQDEIDKDEARADELTVMRDAVSPRKYQLDRYPYSTE